MAKGILAGRCDAITADRSVIVSVRSMANDPSRYLILPETISYEPLAPAVPGLVIRIGRDGLGELGDLRIDYRRKKRRHQRANRQLFRRQLPEIQRLLGTSGDFGKMIALPNTWASNAIKAVGNYGELFDRHFGPTTSMALDRGPNRLWTEGGLMFAPPFR